MTEAPKRHPEGTFDARLVEWGEIKRSRSGSLWHMPAVLDTEHGRTWAYFAGVPATLVMLKRAEAYYKTLVLKVKVKHVHAKGLVYVGAEIKFERGEFDGQEAAV